MLEIDSKILEKVLGRKESFLASDLLSARPVIQDAIGGCRILVIGAAGSIGCSFVKELFSFDMEALHLVDISENNLAEFVRDLRSAGVSFPEDFQTFSLDFGGLEMAVLLASQKYDYVLNFSALKHVRSERDAYTLMRLLDVNVLANERLLNTLSNSHVPQKVFSVSSDKAVRPANLMGASKAFMERVFLSYADEIPFGSARFANVAFSDGSLLHSFQQRIGKRQPLSAPSDVKRYFISHQEAGQLCILGCFTGYNREIVYPDFRPDEDMMTFSEIAVEFLKMKGLEPLYCESEEEARTVAAQLSSESKQWPCLFTGSDTSGEKMYEEFVDPTESISEDRFYHVGVITEPVFHGSDILKKAIRQLKDLRAAGQWNLDDLIATVGVAVPELEHAKAAKNLDQKM